MIAPNITVDQLRVFVAVVETGSFSAAARRLRRVQSAISHAVASLEAQLQLSLFDRREWRPRLTADGLALVADARAVLERTDAFKARAKGLSEGLEAQLSMVVDVMFPTDHLVELLGRFQERFPRVLLDLRIEALGSVPELVISGVCRLGIQGTFPDVADELEAHPLAAIALQPVAAAGHPLAAAQTVSAAALADHVQIVLSDRSARTQGRTFAVLSKRQIRTADLGSKHAMLRGGLGWGYMPETIVADDLASGRLVRLALDTRPAGPLALPLFLIHRRSDPPGPAGRWVMEALKTACQGAAATRAPERASVTRRSAARTRTQATRARPTAAGR